jgi:hypothetical protein
MFENLTCQGLAGAFGYNRNSMKTHDGNLLAKINGFNEEPK